jgi:adenylate cyclase class IV
LDQVKGLGNFIEVEKFSTDDTFKIQEELFRFLETLGVKRKDRVLHGYDVLVYNQQSTINNKRAYFS